MGEGLHVPEATHQAAGLDGRDEATAWTALRIMLHGLSCNKNCAAGE